MRQVISYLFIVFVAALSLCVGIQAETSPLGASGTKMVLSLNSDTNDSIALNAAILKELPQSSASLKAETVFVIGESAISRITKNSTNRSKEATGQALADNAKLTGLYSEMGSAFSIASIPIKPFKYSSKISKFPGDLFPGFANDPNELSRYYFEPDPLSLPAIYIPPSGNKESVGGVTVIWQESR
jgi:hypothetical protein